MSEAKQWDVWPKKSESVVIFRLTVHLIQQIIISAVLTDSYRIMDLKSLSVKYKSSMVYRTESHSSFYYFLNCHLSICMCCVLRLVSQSCPTLCNLMDCIPLDSSVQQYSPGKNTGVGYHALLIYLYTHKITYFLIRLYLLLQNLNI